MRIPNFTRLPRRYKEFLFDDLPSSVRVAAQGWLSEFYRRHQHRLASEPWLYPVLIGQARRLALNPPTSEWGRSMLAKRGGKAVQEMYRWQGRTGERHPARKASRVSVSNRRWQKQKHEEKQKRIAQGLPPPVRSKWLDTGW